MKKITLPLGIASGILLSLAMLAPLTNPTMETLNDGSTGFLEMFLASLGAIVTMVYLAIKNPEIKFSQSVKYAVITSAVTALVFYIGNVIYFKTVNTEYVGQYYDLMTQKRVAGITDATVKANHIANAAKDRPTYTNPFIYSIFPTLLTFMFSLMPIAVCGYIIFRVNRFRNSRKKVK